MLVLTRPRLAGVFVDEVVSIKILQLSEKALNPVDAAVFEDEFVWVVYVADAAGLETVIEVNAPVDGVVLPIGSGLAQVLPSRVEALSPPGPPPLMVPVTVRLPPTFVFPNPSTVRSGAPYGPRPARFPVEAAPLYSN